MIPKFTGQEELLHFVRVISVVFLLGSLIFFFLVLFTDPTAASG
jgi:hypothetical protein